MTLNVPVCSFYLLEKEPQKKRLKSFAFTALLKDFNGKLISLVFSQFYCKSNAINVFSCLRISVACFEKLDSDSKKERENIKLAEKLKSDLHFVLSLLHTRSHLHAVYRCIQTTPRYHYSCVLFYSFG